MIKKNAVVYVAGPYSAENAWGREVNIRIAEEMSLDLAICGFTPILTHTLARFWFGAISEPRAIEIGLTLLELANAVVLLRDWERSNGTLGEIRHAYDHAIPVFENRNDLMKAHVGEKSKIVIPHLSGFRSIDYLRPGIP